NSNIVLSSVSNIESNINNKNKFLVKSVFDISTKLSQQLLSCPILDIVD
ncbi:18134_t:CDS:1, partial [Racocetra persica]